MTDPKAAAEALEAFGKKHIAVLRGSIGDILSDRLDEEIALLRAQAAASPEPVAWMYHNTETDGNVVLMERLKIDERYIETPLYAHPPAEAERIIAEHSGLLAGLTRYSSSKWGIMENPMGEYLRAADVKAALDTEKTMHLAWRKRAEDAEARLAVFNSGGFADADALAARFITLEAELAKVKAECKEWEEAYYNQVGIREDELKPKIARLEGDVVRWQREWNKAFAQMPDLAKVKANLAESQMLESAVAGMLKETEASLALMKAERDAALADKEYAIRMFDAKEAACLKALEERDAALAALEQIADPSAFIHYGNGNELARRYEEIAQAALDARKEGA